MFHLRSLVKGRVAFGFHKVCRKNENHRNCIFRLDSFVGSPKTQTIRCNMCVCVCVCMCLFCHLRVSFNATQKISFYCHTRTRTAGSCSNNSASGSGSGSGSGLQLLSFCLYFIRFTICVSSMTLTPTAMGQGSDPIPGTGHVRSFQLNVCAFCGRL